MTYQNPHFCCDKTKNTIIPISYNLKLFMIFAMFK